MNVAEIHVVFGSFVSPTGVHLSLRLAGPSPPIHRLCSLASGAPACLNLPPIFLPHLSLFSVPVSYYFCRVTSPVLHPSFLCFGLSLQVLCYVPTGFGTTDVSVVTAIIDTYESFYPSLCGGYFLDEGPGTAENTGKCEITAAVGPTLSSGTRMSGEAGTSERILQEITRAR